MWTAGCPDDPLQTRTTRQWYLEAYGPRRLGSGLLEAVCKFW